MTADVKYIRNSVPLANPDFNGIRNAIKEFLKGQPELADYDFDGSVASVLLDKLAYDAHFQVFYLNMVGNESFLSTAVKRESVVERAKLVDYFPRTARCARAIVYADFEAPSFPSAITLPRGETLFTSNYAGSGYNWGVLDSISVPLANSEYVVPKLTLVEGKFVTKTFRYLTSSLREGFVLPDQNIDSTTIRVRVTETDASNVTYNYDLYEDFVSLSDTDRVFFLEEVDGGFIKVTFGDGVIGKKPMIGDTISVSYFVSNLDSPNGAYAFSYSGSILNVDGATAIVDSVAAGGSSPESIQSIKFTAPKSYEAQNRAVTSSDYEFIIKSKFDNVEDVVVWGGETAVPPKYGFVFISIKPKVGTVLSNSDKAALKDLLKRYNVVSITPEVVDPDYTYVLIDLEVNFDQTRTNLGVGDIESLTKNTVLNFIDNSLEKFDKALRNSVLTRMVDAADYSIINSNAIVKLQKRIFPTFGQPLTTTLEFNAAVKAGSLFSTTFTYGGISGCSLATSAAAPTSIDVVRYVNDVVSTIATGVGTIDLTTGTVNIINFIAQDVPNNSQFKTVEGIPFIGIAVEPVDQDVFPRFNQIITTEERYISSKAVVEKNYRP